MQPHARASTDADPLLAAPKGGRRKSRGVLDTLGQKIVAGEFPEDSMLPTEAGLAGQFGVSRPSLREALLVLARKGLIEARARRGTRVLGIGQWDVLDPDVLRWMVSAPPDPGFLIDLLEVRTFIEPEAARLAARGQMLIAVPLAAVAFWHGDLTGGLLLLGWGAMMNYLTGP